MACTGPNQTPPFNSSLSCLAAYFSSNCFRLLQKHMFHVLWAYHPHVHLDHLTLQYATVAHVMSKSRVSHLTGPAGPLTCFHLLTYLLSPCLILLLFPSLLPNSSAQTSVATGWRSPLRLPSCSHPERATRDVELFFPCTAAICSINFTLSAGGILSSPHSRGDQAHPQQFPHACPHVVLLKCRVSLSDGNLCSQLPCHRSHVPLPVFPHFLQGPPENHCPTTKCILVNGSAWSMEKECMDRYRNKFGYRRSDG